ncbi:MAG: pirin family protein [Pseudomonadales bacterium]|nr:pirin family protein [Pseudomonadales bacterium]
MATPILMPNKMSRHGAVADHGLLATNGRSLEIGTGFKALTFREKDFPGAMDPLVMVDHYTMTEPTFGVHPHAGLSAVSVLFEDSEGRFHNRDTLGNDFDLLPGDLYWLKAGAGVVHDESPRPGARIHGLQVFVNLPSVIRSGEPESMHVKAQSVPVLEGEGTRVRILLGSSNGITTQQSLAVPMTILDGRVDKDAGFTHTLEEAQSAWIVAIEGQLELTISGRGVTLSAGQAIAVSAAALAEMNDHLVLSIGFTNKGEASAHFVLFAAKPIGETFVQKGPFVMDSLADIERVESDYLAGKFGRLA